MSKPASIHPARPATEVDLSSGLQGISAADFIVDLDGDGDIDLDQLLAASRLVGAEATPVPEAARTAPEPVMVEHASLRLILDDGVDTTVNTLGF